MNDEEKSKKKRVRCDILDDDGCVIGFAISSCVQENDRFREFAWNTNDVTSGAVGTFYFDEDDLAERD